VVNLALPTRLARQIAKKIMTIQLGILQLIIGLCAIMVGGLIVYFVINYNIKKEEEERKKNKVHNYEI
jgi:uncharacterized protein YjeT (DUF2065 family)